MSTGFVAYTSVRIARGGVMAIRTMATNVEEEDVLTCDQNGHFAMRHAVQPRQTGTASSLIYFRVNGSDVRCTPDVQFMLADRTYKAARDLKQGDVFLAYPRGVKAAVDAPPLAVDLPAPVSVYDMSVRDPSNFALSCGIFALALGVVWTGKRVARQLT